MYGHNVAGVVITKVEGGSVVDVWCDTQGGRCIGPSVCVLDVVNWVEVDC